MSVEHRTTDALREPGQAQPGGKKLDWAQRAPRLAKFFRLLKPLTSYVLVNVTVLFFWIFFFVLNRTTVIGRKRVGEDRNTLLLSNHQSMIDSFLVGICAWYPKSWIKPYLIPWNPAAVENFFKHPVLVWLSYNYRCIPVRLGRRDPFALRQMIDVLPGGVMVLFPEGTRTRDGTVGGGRAGAGYVVLSTRPKLIPVAIDGMQDVLPIGSVIPRVFKRIYVSYGEPIDYSEFRDQPRNTETAQAIVDKAMDQVRALHAEIRRLRAGKQPPP